jgi:valyl-tRNA synthetase
MIGKKYQIPGVLGEFEVVVVGDESVNPEFGSGAVKVTPAHSLADFEIAQRHHLPVKTIIDKRGRMMENCGKYAGMTTSECREAIVQDMQAMGLIEKIDEDYQNKISVHDRCGHAIEPLILEQWFVKIAPLAKPAFEAVKTGKIKFMPERFEKIYFNWMENIRDWNISRQVWWGHRVPVYYLVEDRTKFVVAENANEAKILLGGEVEQDKDTLDTWFSSGLWPFVTLGWPEPTADFKYFYPTTMMETAYDIIFFWVARMIMMGLYCTDKIPFETVFFNGLVRDSHGQKISKSKGNVIDPLVMVERYGADALRMGLVTGTAAGNDTSISEDKIRAYRNFANKIWNAARLLTMKQPKGAEIGDVKLSDRDEEVLKEFGEAVANMTKMMEGYQLGQASEFIYDYFWHTFCDKVIEEYKDQLDNPSRQEAAAAVLHHILKNSLVMMHPFVPFATEAVWSELYEGQLISAQWPK